VDQIVRLDGLWKIYRAGLVEVPALRDVNLTIRQGEYVAVMGHSGSGKSTLLNLLGCLDKPTKGKYQLAGDDVSFMSDDELSEVRNLKIGFVFQSFNLIPWLTAAENVEVPLFYRGVPRWDRHPRSRELAELVGLGDRIHHRPSEMSGGEQQRVAIARSMANDPVILLADEPTGNLDSSTTGEILDLLSDLHRRGMTIIVVTHEADVAARTGRVIYLRDGQVESDKRNESPA